MLKDILLKNSYSSGFDEPREFFTEALIESKNFDLGLGFFSSSGIRSLSYGFALFVANGGKMRVVINDVLSEADKRAILLGQKNKVADELCERIISDIEKMKETFSQADELFFRCFSYLISIKRIEFVATLSAKGGLAHDKYGIFTDSKGDKVAFIGSANFSHTALELNSETITVFSSWKDSERVSEYQEMFNNSWEHDTSHLIHIPIERVKAYVLNDFKAVNTLELIKAGISLREIEDATNSSVEIKPLPQKLLDKLEQKEMEPRFPFPCEREAQFLAYKAWKQNDNKGIFAMATGTGKTVTALNCALKEWQQNNYYKLIIVVPTQALALQWEKEAKAFNFQNIVSTHTEKDWKNILSRYATNSIFNSKKNIVIITTYATFILKHFQSFLHSVKNSEDFIFIADEAHNLGASGPIKKLPVFIKNRIGLSATPERIYDEIGSSQLYDFFNSKPPKYTYRFTMKEAIEQGILCHYDYTPVFVELTNIEMSEYRKVTDQLRKFLDPETGKYKPEAEMLLMKRKRIIHKAENKKVAIIRMLDDLTSESKLKYTFVFVPEGYEPDYSVSDSYNIAKEDMHLIDEYSDIFRERRYHYHKFISGLEDAPEILKGFASGDIDVLLSMKCLDEGVDVPRAENAIFLSSTGNPRQFIQRRGRVLRKHQDKEKAHIWDMVVVPPDISENLDNSIEKNLFLGEVKRIINFASLADNRVSIIYSKLNDICMTLGIDLFQILEDEEKQYE